MAVSVERQVRDLQNSLDTLRAEVDLKMEIIEQILATRNEQFAVQKKLIEEEHALYEKVLNRWRNRNRDDRDYSNQNNARPLRIAPEVSISHTTKRNSTDDFPMTSERIRLRAKRRRTSPNAESYDFPTSVSQSTSFIGKIEQGTDGGSDIDDDTVLSDVDPLDAETETDVHNEEECDDDPVIDDNGMEKQTFVNIYLSDSDFSNQADTSDPIWLHFLHEEKGTRALCKHCNEKGLQKIYQCKDAVLTVLRTHLRTKHKITVEAPKPAPSTVEATESPQNEPALDIRKRNNLRHNNYMYRLNVTRGTVNYFRCRESGLCSGRVIRRNGIIEETAEHSCLTSAADCDAVEIQDKIRDLAETDMPAQDIIAAAKQGYSSEAIALLPSNSALVRSIRRMRLKLAAAPPLDSDWT